MGLPNPGLFIEIFEKAARREGLDVTQCNTDAVLLKCALEAGWKSNGLIVRKQ